MNDPHDPPSPERDLLDALRRSSSPPEITLEKRRYGKDVTILSGFAPDIELAPLAKQLKQRLAVGGSVKDQHIELQGDQRGRARAILAELGFETDPSGPG